MANSCFRELFFKDSSTISTQGDAHLRCDHYFQLPAFVFERLGGLVSWLLCTLWGGRQSVAVEREGNVLLSVAVSPMDRPNVYHTHAQIIPPKDTLAEKNWCQGTGHSVCVCVYMLICACVCVQLIIHLSMSWKYCDCSTFPFLFTHVTPGMQNITTWIILVGALIPWITGCAFYFAVLALPLSDMIC